MRHRPGGNDDDIINVKGYAIQVVYLQTYDHNQVNCYFVLSRLIMALTQIKEN